MNNFLAILKCIFVLLFFFIFSAQAQPMFFNCIDTDNMASNILQIDLKNKSAAWGSLQGAPSVTEQDIVIDFPVSGNIKRMQGSISRLNSTFFLIIDDFNGRSLLKYLRCTRIERQF